MRIAMITLEDMKSLLGSIKNKVLANAEYLLKKFGNKKYKGTGAKWADVASRGRSINETAAETVLFLREEERW
jgi:hypothetical protein